VRVQFGARTGRSVPRAIGGAAIVVGLAACGGGSGEENASGESAAESEGFYQGETIDLVVPYDPGGGYDVYARAMAPYLGECLGADIVVRNEPGAGGLLATNATAVADPEEPRLLVTNTVGFAAAQIADAEGVQFDLAEMSWLGRVADATPAVTVGADSEIGGFADIIDASEPVRFVATGPGGDDYIVPTVLSAAYGFPVDVITGFPGSGEARTALVAGDADAQALSLTSQVPSVQSGEVRAVLVVDEEANELLPDAPPISEFPAADEEAQELVDSLVTLGASGRGIVAPPGLAEERLAELREGLDCALSSEALLEDLGPERPINPMGGAEYAEQVEALLDASPEFEAAIKASF
jgi:tripartite-type tricarboxylate transporter receptor subunit TctC